MADMIRWTGDVLQQPIYALSESVIEAWTFANINPDLRTQYDTPMLEVARRIRALTLDTVLVALLSVTLGAASLAIKAMANLIDNTGFTHILGNTEPETGPIHSILSFNVNMFPGGLPLVLGGIDPASYRIDELCTLIKTHDPDIVCLQEVSTAVSYSLIDQLKDNYAHFIFNGATPALMMDAGLFIATKKAPSGPIEFIEFTEEGRQNGIHRGYFVIPFEDKVVVVTHLEPGEGPTHATIRESELASIFTHLTTKYPLSPLVVCGDLNIRRSIDGDEDEFTGVTAFTNHDFTPVLTSEKTVTDQIEAARNNETLDEVPTQLDYFATHSLAAPHVEVLNAINETQLLSSLSDHQPLLATWS